MGGTSVTPMEVVHDTTVTEKVIHTSDTVVTFKTNYVYKEIIVPDTILKPIFVYSDSSRQYHGYATADSCTVFYRFTASSDSIYDMSFEIEYPNSTVIKVITDSITIYRDSLIHTTKIVAEKSKLRLYGGGGLGYNVRESLPAVEVIFGLADKKHRLWYLSFEAVTQQIKLGVLVPLTK